MSTGATPEQIEAAMRRFSKGSRSPQDATPFEETSPHHRAEMRHMAEIAAESLVPSDHRIIGPEDVAAISELLRALPMVHGNTKRDDMITRLNALIGDSR